MRFDLPSRPRDSEENILPLINVVFLLLIFFMLAGTLAMPGAFPVDPPRSVSEATAETGPVVVLIGADGRVALDGELVEPEALQDRLAERLTEEADVQVKADGAAPANFVLPVLDAVRRAGVARVQLLTAAS